MSVDLGVAGQWARAVFGQARLGDLRRQRRLLCVVARAAERPGGRISAVFRKSAERQGAYDLLVNNAVRAQAIVDAMGDATLREAATESFVFVAVDGTSLRVVDRAGRKGMGPLTASRQAACGVKIISALAVRADGTPIGVTDLRWWVRTRKRKTRVQDRRQPKDKELGRWIEALETTVARCAVHAPRTRCWFQLDREADAWPLLVSLADNGHLFTVRSNHNRVLADGARLADVLGGARSMGRYELEVSGGPGRTARVATMQITCARVTLDMKDARIGEHHAVVTNVVRVREASAVPAGEKPIEWTLLTNAQIKTFEQARLVVHGYTQRWRIEEFHRAWKSGVCNIEETQLRGVEPVMKWAAILAAVAVRAEKLKQLARTTPDLPASVELSRDEVHALIRLKRLNKKRTEEIPATMPTIGQAVVWLAELGGYTGKSSGGPPGATTIGRGLQYVAVGVDMLEALRIERKMR
jgi:hypothetical protein